MPLGRRLRLTIEMVLAEATRDRAKFILAIIGMAGIVVIGMTRAGPRIASLFMIALMLICFVPAAAARASRPAGFTGGLGWARFLPRLLFSVGVGFALLLVSFAATASFPGTSVAGAIVTFAVGTAGGWVMTRVTRSLN